MEADGAFNKKSHVVLEAAKSALQEVIGATAERLLVERDVVSPYRNKMGRWRYSPK